MKTELELRTNPGYNAIKIGNGSIYAKHGAGYGNQVVISATGDAIDVARHLLGEANSEDAKGYPEWRLTKA